MATNPTNEAEALRLIQETAVKAAGGANRIVTLPHEPPGVYGIIDEEGKIEKKFATRKAKRHGLLSIGAIKDALEHYAEVLGVISPVVFYSTDQVTVILNDSTELPFGDSLYVPLKGFCTDQWDIITKLAEQNFDQRGFIQILRQGLWDCIGEPGQALVNMVRALDWSNSAHTQSKIDKGRSSYGHDIEAEVRSTHGGELPDELLLSVRIYNDPALTVRRGVRCALEADPVRHTFNLAPFAGEIERALDDEMQHIHGILENELDCAIIYGVPGS